MPQGLILFAHGARDPRWAEPFVALQARVQALRPDWAVRLAFLELMTPGLPAAAAELAEAGCLQVTIRPMFLGTGGHLRRDLPLLIETLQRTHPQVQWQLEPAIGEHAQVIAAMALAAAGLPEGVPP
ncbi:MAG: CbiX/SirB N-terminal domain-containing protein [Rubrivivax sp.]|nr:CbiX/SirB N-terminal domain-containing protein [Rubrivivax sp.]